MKKSNTPFGLLFQVLGRGDCKKMAQEVNTIFSAFIRGQLVVVIFLSISYALGLYLMGVRFGVVIGIIAGFLSLIPYVGSTVGVALALGVAFAYGGGLPLLIGIAIFFVAVQNFGGVDYHTQGGGK